MKANKYLAALLTVSVISNLAHVPETKAQTLLTDHFDYTTGDTLGANGWNLINSSGGAATLVVAQDLSYPGFAESSGNAVQLRPNGQDWYKTYTTQSFTTSESGTVFYSFLFKVDNLGLLDATGGYFAGLGNATGASLASTVAVRASGTGFQIGVGKRDSTAMGNFSFANTVFDLNTTILVVGSYNVVAGAINNDFANLWINPTGLGQSTAPTATLTTALSGINDDVISFSSFVLKPQGNASSTQIPASLIFDEVRVGTTWADVAVIPEPSTALMLGLLIASFLLVRHIRRRAA